MVKFKEIPTHELFIIENVSSLDKQDLNKKGPTDYPYVTRTRLNNGIESYTGYIDEEHLNPENTFSLGLMQMSVNFQEHAWYGGQFVKVIKPKIEINHEVGLYLQTWLKKLALTFDPQAIRNVEDLFYKGSFNLPVNDDNTINNYYIEKEYLDKINNKFKYLD